MTFDAKSQPLTRLVFLCTTPETQKNKPLKHRGTEGAEEIGTREVKENAGIHQGCFAPIQFFLLRKRPARVRQNALV